MQFVDNLKIINQNVFLEKILLSKRFQKYKPLKKVAYIICVNVYTISRRQPFYYP